MMENDRKRVRVSGDVDLTVGTVVVVVVASAVERSLCRAREWTAGGGGATRATERMIEIRGGGARKSRSAPPLYSAIALFNFSALPLWRFGGLAVSCQSHPLLCRSRSIDPSPSLARPRISHSAATSRSFPLGALRNEWPGGASLDLDLYLSRGFYYFFRRASLAEREVSIAPGPSCERVARCAALRRARHSQRLLL